MNLKTALEDKLMDVRLRDRFLSDNKISEQDINKYLGTLEDDVENCVEIDSEEQ